MNNFVVNMVMFFIRFLAVRRGGRMGNSLMNGFGVTLDVMVTQINMMTMMMAMMMAMMMTMMMAMMMTMMVLMMVAMVKIVMMTMMVFMMVTMVVSMMVSMVIFVMVSMVFMVAMMISVVLFGNFIPICGNVLSTHSNKLRRFRRSIIRFDDCRGDKCQHSKSNGQTQHVDWHL